MGRPLPLTYLLALALPLAGACESSPHGSLAPNGKLCTHCQSDDQCGAGGLCTADSAGVSVCSTPCQAHSDCPSGYQCYQIAGDNNQVTGAACLPSNGQSCADRPATGGDGDGGATLDGGRPVNPPGTDGGGETPDSGEPGPPSGFPVCTPDNWATYAQGFVQVECVRCHADYTDYGTIETQSARIRSDLVGKTMPPDMMLTDDDLDRIVRWIDCDMPP
jgi:hypothetical protein